MGEGATRRGETRRGETLRRGSTPRPEGLPCRHFAPSPPPHPLISSFRSQKPETRKPETRNRKPELDLRDCAGYHCTTGQGGECHLATLVQLGGERWINRDLPHSYPRPRFAASRQSQHPALR